MGALIDAVLTAFVVTVALGGLLCVLVMIMEKLGWWSSVVVALLVGMCLFTMVFYYN